MPVLTALRLRSLTAPGLYGDGGNLWLQVRGPGRRSWLFRFTLHGRARSMGLGSADDVTLAEARNRADAARALLRDGIDPLAHRDAARVEAIATAARAVTFAQVTERYVTAQEAGWRSMQHRAVWRASMAQHVLPILAPLPVQAIDTSLVLKVLEPLWTTIPETASRLRGRIESVLSYATARGWREGPNPALWRGHLQLMLPRKSKVRPVQHFAALDWREAPTFMATLRALDSIGARALQFLLLTAARSGEVRYATWDEIDLDSAVWTLPPSRMKAAKPHRVPLSPAALAVLEAVMLLRCPGGVVFPGPKLRRPITNVTLAAPLRLLGRADLTVHGFRSTFRDWAAEATAYPNHVVEQALAHTIGSAVEAAYRRGDLFAKRVALMDDWAAYLAQPAAQVVPLRAARQGAGVGFSGQGGGA
jgi:integrase